jgi:hypothetical protein
MISAAALQQKEQATSQQQSGKIKAFTRASLMPKWGCFVKPLIGPFS